VRRRRETGTPIQEEHGMPLIYEWEAHYERIESAWESRLETDRAYSRKNREKNRQNQHSSEKTKLERRGDERKALSH
jgi:hypothetical protein